MNALEKIQYVEKELSERTISREGKDHFECNVCICNYPERPNLAQYDPLSLNIDCMLGMGNARFRLELIGYGTRETVLLKMSNLPFVWIFVPRPPDTPFLDPSFEFSTTNESLLVKKFGEELYAAKGDATAYVQSCYVTTKLPKQ